MNYLFKSAFWIGAISGSFMAGMYLSQASSLEEDIRVIPEMTKEVYSFLEEVEENITKRYDNNWEEPRERADFSVIAKHGSTGLPPLYETSFRETYALRFDDPPDTMKPGMKPMWRDPEKENYGFGNDGLGAVTKEKKFFEDLKKKQILDVAEWRRSGLMHADELYDKMSQVYSEEKAAMYEPENEKLRAQIALEKSLEKHEKEIFGNPIRPVLDRDVKLAK